jgi:hypothetical protein
MPALKRYQLTDEDIFCFLHIPKTGGTTLQTLLRANFPREVLCPSRDWRTLQSLGAEALKHYRFFGGHWSYRIHTYLPKSPTHYISFLRDPIERVISQYEFFRRTKSEALYKLTNQLSLTEFLYHEMGQYTLCDLQTRYLAPSDGRVSAYHTTSDHLGLEVAIQRLQEFSFVGLVERYDDGLALLAYTFNWPPFYSMAKAKVAPKDRLKQDEIDPDTLATIKAMNANDIVLYEAAKALFEKRYAEMVSNLLDTQYCIQNIPTARRPRRYEFQFTEDPIPGSGWYWPVLLNNGKGHRWTGPGAISTLYVPIINAEQITLEFTVVRFVEADMLDSLEVYAEDIPLQLSREDKRGRYVFRAVIPTQNLPVYQSSIKLSFVVNRTIAPADTATNNQDRNPKGLAFRDLRLLPAEPSATD